MSILTMLFALATVIATGLALLAVRAAAPVPQKVGALVLAAALLPLGYLAMAELLSRSKPVALDWWRAEAEEGTVVASHLMPEEGIHLWLLLEGAEEPRAFVLPWDRELAEALHCGLMGLDLLPDAGAEASKPSVVAKSARLAEVDEDAGTQEEQHA